MEIGSAITLRINNTVNSNETDMYRCKIIDKNDQYVFVDYPINIKTNKTKIFEINEPITINYVQGGIAHEFITSIAKRVKLTVPALAITLPDEEEITRIQRREFVRVKTDVDVAIHFPNSVTPPLISVTYDISGGGAAVIIPPNIQLNEKQVVTLYFVLHSLSINYQYIKVDAEIVRFHTIDKINIMSLKFLLDSDREQQKIINFCFDKQREKRKQGLL